MIPVQVDIKPTHRTIDYEVGLLVGKNKFDILMRCKYGFGEVSDMFGILDMEEQGFGKIDLEVWYLNLSSVLSFLMKNKKGRPAELKFDEFRFLVKVIAEECVLSYDDETGEEISPTFVTSTCRMEEKNIPRRFLRPNGPHKREIKGNFDKRRP